jgi:recombination protein RecT
LLEKKAGDIIQILGGDKQKLEKFKSNVVRLYSSTDLKECSPISVLGASMQAAYLNLDLDPNLGQAYVLARYNNKTKTKEANFQTGYQGLVELVRRSGQLVNYNVNVVYENEPFNLEYTLDGTKFSHQPLPPSQRGKAKVGAYMVAKLETGSHFEWLWAEEILEVKKLSQSGGSQYSPWNANLVSEEAMWKKTVIRRAVKSLPKSVELAKVVSLEEASEFGRRVDYSAVAERGEAEIDNGDVVIEASVETHDPETGEVKYVPSKGNIVAEPIADEKNLEKLF